MDAKPLSKFTISFGLSLALCSVANAVLVVVKEKSLAVTLAMKSLTGHHWVTHATAVVLLFILGGWLFSRLNGGRGPQISADRLIGIVLAGTVIGGLVIMGFYLIAD